MDKLEANVCNRLRALRIGTGISSTKIARLIGVKSETWAATEFARVKVSWERGYKFCRAMNISLRVLGDEHAFHRIIKLGNIPRFTPIWGWEKCAERSSSFLTTFMLIEDSVLKNEEIEHRLVGISELAGKLREMGVSNVTIFRRAFVIGNASFIPWVNCSDKLPESNTSILITSETHLGKRGEVDVDAGIYLGDGRWKWHDGHLIDGRVLAWAEMPYPYQEMPARIRLRGRQ